MTTTTKNNKALADLVQAVTPAQVRSVYASSAGCRCGCLGTYSYNPAFRDASSEERGYPVTDDEVSQGEVIRVLRLLQAAAEVEVVDGNCLDVSGDGDGEVLTVYLMQPLTPEVK